jgi:transcriptional regulator with XRE-family HTH domain
MIKNNKQVLSAKRTLKDLEMSFSEFIIKKSEMSEAEFELGSSSFSELIKDTENEIKEYEELVNGNFHCFKPQRLSDVNKVLIAARIAKKISQRELAKIIGIQEQQIQRYEATDYESATWTRIQEIAMALNIKFYFEKIILLHVASNFQNLNFGDTNCIEEAKLKVKRNHSLMCIE